MFTAFIDESGDEGYNIVPPPARKSTEWFILGAAIVADAELHAVNTAIGHARFHFRSESHHRCVEFAERIAGLPITASIIAFHKPSTPDNTALRGKAHYLFDYSTKLLIERISWYCANHPQPGVVKIIFSQRRQLKLDRIKAYIRRLHMLTHLRVGGVPAFDARNSINWSVIDTNRIEMRPHDSLPGLKVADAVASGCAKAIEWSPSYNTEHRYIKILKDRFYRHRGRCSSYGMKIIPSDMATREGNQAHQRFHWLRHFA
jgi:hypothetical protein